MTKKTPREACRDEAPYGNAAAIRSALEDLVYNIEIRAAAYDIFSIVDKKTWLGAKAALAEPARNCDRFRNETEAEDAYIKEHPHEDEPDANTYGAWLLHTEEKHD